MVVVVIEVLVVVVFFIVIPRMSRHHGHKIVADAVHREVDER